MKTFKQFINESDVSFSTGGRDSLLSFLKGSCESVDEILNAGSTLIRGQTGKLDVVYRGNDDNYFYTVYKARTVKGRTPVDIPAEQAGFINDWFEEHGFGAPRSDGVFTAAGDYADQVADMYGGNQVFSIFPIGTATYVWSDTVYDLYNELMELADREECLIAELDEDQIFDMMNGHKWHKNTNPGPAIKDAREAGSALEIIAMCDEFLCLHVEDHETGKTVKNPEVIARILKGM